MYMGYKKYINFPERTEMEMNIVDVRENLAEVINRVAYAGERSSCGGAEKAWQPWFPWQTSRCFKPCFINF